MFVSHWDKEALVCFNDRQQIMEGVLVCHTYDYNAFGIVVGIDENQVTVKWSREPDLSPLQMVQSKLQALSGRKLISPNKFRKDAKELLDDYISNNSAIESYEIEEDTEDDRAPYTFNVKIRPRIIKSINYIKLTLDFPHED